VFSTVAGWGRSSQILNSNRQVRPFAGAREVRNALALSLLYMNSTTTTNSHPLSATWLPLPFFVAFLTSAPVFGASIRGNGTAVLNDESPEIVSAFSTTASMIVAAVAAGVLITAILVALLWRRKAHAPDLNTDASDRIKDAGSGVPPVSALQQWKHSKLLGVTERLVESDGYSVEHCGDILCLSRHGVAGPCVLVLCAANGDSAVSKQALEEFANVLPGVATRWVVSPSGFSVPALKYASAHNGFMLIDGHKFASMLRDVPPFLINKVLHEGAGQLLAA
jgi:hypothetical protein